MYNPFSIEGKNILVTGASSGIGRAIAIECSRMGANIIITARNRERLNETFLMMETSLNHKMIEADLSDVEAIDNLVEKIPYKLDGVVHCAGFTIIKPFQLFKDEDINGIMDVNFYAPLFLTRNLIKKKLINKDASIVFISSISGVFVLSYGGSLYSASKGAINGLVKGIALELATKSIRVNSVNPGMVDTNILSKGIITEEQLKEDAKKYPLRRYGKPEEIAHGVIYLLSEASKWVTGSNLVIDGGYTLL